MADDSSDRDLTGDFNEASRQYLEGDIPERLLLVKYGLLMNFRARENEDKDRLSDALLDCALQFLRKHATLDQGYISSDKKASAAALLAALGSPENAGFLPRRAPGALADLGLEFTRLAQGAQDERDREDMTDFAALCLEHAGKFRDILDLRDEDISTSKPITPAKPMVLKAKGNGRRPGAPDEKKP